MAGFLSQGLAPWVILADGPGGLSVPGFARAGCHGDGTSIRFGTSGTNAADDAPPRLSQYWLSRLICWRPTSALSESREAAYPRMHGLVQRYGSIRTRRLEPDYGRPAGRRAGGCGAQSKYIAVRSVAGKPGSVRRQISGFMTRRSSPGRSPPFGTQTPVDRRANPQKVRNPRLPSRRDRK